MPSKNSTARILSRKRARLWRTSSRWLQKPAAGPEHITRLTWFVTDKKDYLSHLRELGDAYRAVMGKHFPTMTLVQVVALVEDLAKVEIEATAVVPHR